MSTLKNPHLLALVTLWLLVLNPAAARSQERFYSTSDFGRTEKVDAHMHVYGRADLLMAEAARDRFHILAIDVDSPEHGQVSWQIQDSASLRQRYPGRVAFAGTFSAAGFTKPGWSRTAVRQIEDALAQGAAGIKIWKNFGMVVRDTNGRYVMPDDPRLEPIYSTLEHEHVVLLGHMAEPLDCWLPYSKMTVKGDADYYRQHPQYYMYLHPDMPKHDEILAARDRMLAAHPRLRFDAVHLASLEWDVGRIAAFLDRFPEANVDMAARISHLEHQAETHPDEVRAFFIRYQDRILYGTDDEYGPKDNDPQAVAQIAADWRRDWRFLVTDDEMRSPDLDRAFRGMHLPRSVVDKIYRENAVALFPRAWPGLRP
ncbi:MAG TPA: amidohydrolase family protein [Steroidobacteraceae bacterium]|nr:amidohydrolase family protein [Steroidobacteraceae bacterium]